MTKRQIAAWLDHTLAVDARQRAHVFRHTFSHEWRKAGGGMDDLVALNGWKSPAMALRYGKSAKLQPGIEDPHYYAPSGSASGVASRAGGRRRRWTAV